MNKRTTLLQQAVVLLLHVCLILPLTDLANLMVYLIASSAFL